MKIIYWTLLVWLILWGFILNESRSCQIDDEYEDENIAVHSGECYYELEEFINGPRNLQTNSGTDSNSWVSSNSSPMVYAEDRQENRQEQ